MSALPEIFSYRRSGSLRHLCSLLARNAVRAYMERREVGAGKRLANPVRSGRKQP